MKRQLQLPGTVRRPAAAPARAKKDLSASAFQRACYRHGFRRSGITFSFIDTTSDRLVTIEAVYRVNPIRIARRATLAKLIRHRNGGTT